MAEDTTIHQFLTFTLDEEMFALNIGSVKEVLEHTRITKVPRTPRYMKGVINLRGHAVPIVDMRLKFGLSEGELTVNTCMIIVEVRSGGDSVVQIGALVDSVREVIEIQQNEIEGPPQMGLSVDTGFIQGMARRGDDFVLILEVDRIFSAEELKAVTQGGEPAAPQSLEENEVSMASL